MASLLLPAWNSYFLLLPPFLKSLYLFLKVQLSLAVSLTYGFYFDTILIAIE